MASGVNGSVPLGDGLTQRGRYPEGRKLPSWVQGRRPNRGSSGRTSKLILILEMDVKLIFYGGKIEKAYMSRCFLKRTHAAVLSAVQLTIRIGDSQPPHRKFWGMHPPSPWLTPMLMAPPVHNAGHPFLPAQSVIGRMK